MPPEKALEDLFDPLSPSNAQDDPFAQLAGDDAAAVDGVPASIEGTVDAAEAQSPTNATLHSISTGASGDAGEAVPAMTDDKFADLLAEFSPLSEEPAPAPEFGIGVAATAEGLISPPQTIGGGSGQASAMLRADNAADPFDELAAQSSEPPFLEEQAASQVQAGSAGTAGHATDAALFDGGEAGGSAFDELLQQPEGSFDIGGTGAPESPTPDLSIEQHAVSSSLQDAQEEYGRGEASFASDWLADTTVDQSFDINAAEAEESAAEPAGESARRPSEGAGSDPVPFEVPQGWYDEGGEWHWYTEEEREQVRLTMLGEQPGWDAEPETGGLEAPQAAFMQNGSRSNSLGGPYSPALDAGFSENAARRTPQPEQSAAIPSDPYDPYVPSSAQPQTGSSYYPSSGNSSGYYDSYASSSAPSASLSPYAPQQSAYSPAPSSNPYAPSAAAQPYVSTSGYGAISNPAGPRQPLSPPRVDPPQRMASTAYDPPFLKAKKSVAARPVSAAPAAPGFVAPLQGFTASPEIDQVAAPPAQSAPPPGPPRRPKSALQSERPQFDAPPLRPMTQGPGGPGSTRPAAQMESPQASQDAHPARQDPYGAYAPPQAREDDYAPAQAQEHAYAPAPAQESPYVPQQTQEKPYVSQQAQESPYAPQHAQHNAYAPPQAQQSAYALSDAKQNTSAPPSQPSANVASNLAPSSQPPPPKKASFSAFDPPLKPPSMSRPPSAAPSRSGAFAPPPPRSEPTSPAPPPGLSAPPPGPSLAPPPRPPSGAARRSSPAPSFDGPPPSRQSLGRQPSETIRRSLDSGPYRPSSPLRQSSVPDPEVLYGGFGERDLSQRPGFDENDEEGGFERPGADRSDSTRTVTLNDPETLAVDDADPYGPSPSEQSSSYQLAPRQETPYDPAAYQGSMYNPSPYLPDLPLESQSAYNPSPYQPAGQLASHQASPAVQPPALPSASGPSVQQAPYDPYAPTQRDEQDRLSAYSMSPQKSARSIPIYSPNRPLGHLPRPTAVSRASSAYTGASNAYAPSGRTTSPPYGSGSEFGSSPVPNYFSGAMAIRAGDDTYTPQQVLEQRPVSEDPLGRCTVAAQNVPMAVFGFGGVIVTAFPGLADMDSTTMSHARTPSYGYASGRQQVWIRSVSDVVSTSAIKSNEVVFPGPLLLDPAATKGAAAEKKKRDAVAQYLEARAEEIQKGLPYLSSSASAAKREQEGKLVLVRLLAAMLIGEGRLGGKPEVDDAVRKALANPSGSVSTFSNAPAILSPRSAPNQLSPFSAQTHAAPAHATPPQLTHLSELLTQGDKRDAALYAAQEGLWSHALVIGSSVDPELWREIVSRFAASEFGGRGGDTAAMRASYALFSGVGANTLDDLMEAANITDNPSEDRWREVIAAVGLNARPADLVVLDELGRRLQALQLRAAAQVCFLLSPTSPFLDNTLASFERPVMLTQDSPDEDNIVFAEVAEYARSLVTLPKGQELPFTGLPQLLPLKLHRAWVAAEMGETDLALRYCRAIETVSRPTKTTPSVLAPAMVASLQDLLERLTGSPSIDPAKGLGARKGAKPGFDKLGSWIEGRLTKFIAGDDPTSPTQPKVEAPAKGKPGAPAIVGPFSHFSSISPAQSGNISRTPSTADLNGGLGVPGDSRHMSPGISLENRLTLQPADHSRAVSSSSAGSYGEQWGQQSGGAGASYPSWGEQGEETSLNEAQESTNGMPDDVGDEGEFINPMAALTMNTNTDATVTPTYQPSYSSRDDPEEDEDDLGFGNSSLSRARTPRPAGEDDAPVEKSKKAAAPTAPAKEEPAAASPSKGDPKAGGSWLGRWWGKKEGEGSGPVRAKLGEESSMIFDPELKRWVVKGQKPEAAPAPPPPPPARAQTSSPAQAMREKQVQRAATAAPLPAGMTPLSQSQNRAPPGTPPMGSMSSGEGPEGGLGRAQSEPASRPPAPGGTSPGGATPRIVSGVNGSKFAPPPGTSIDDLLSRPSSAKSTGSRAAKKGARNRYVDVFQPPADSG